MPQEIKFTAVVPAAGIGSRMRAARPKQYLMLHQTTVLEHTLRCLNRHPKIQKVVVALHPKDDTFSSLPIASEPWLTAVVGGESRAESVLAGLRLCAPNDWAVVHDAARPNLCFEDLDALLSTVDSKQEGAILASPVRDTMKRAQANTKQIERTEERKDLWHALTPQVFPQQALLQAITQGLAQGVNITDEASAMEWAQHPVHLVQGKASNIKITQPEDILLAEFYLRKNHVV